MMCWCGARKLFIYARIIICILTVKTFWICLIGRRTPCMRCWHMQDNIGGKRWIVAPRVRLNNVCVSQYIGKTLANAHLLCMFPSGG